eukprot:661468-Ditylum_brightwellii.AAC.1
MRQRKSDDYWEISSNAEVQSSCAPSLYTDHIVDNLLEAVAWFKQKENNEDECHGSKEEKWQSLFQKYFGCGAMMPAYVVECCGAVLAQRCVLETKCSCSSCEH